MKAVHVAVALIKLLAAVIRKGFGGIRQEPSKVANAARHLDGCNIH